MIRVYKGNIFDSKTDAIVNTVNCVGVMGKGIALEFKIRYPEMYKKYKEICNNNQLNVGKFFIHKTRDRLVINFPTKIHWKNKSEYSYIVAGLIHFVEIYKSLGIRSIAFPPLGCTNGGLDIKTVLGLMKKYLDLCQDLEVQIWINPNIDFDDLPFQDIW